jgi:hypothetical protein
MTAAISLAKWAVKIIFMDGAQGSSDVWESIESANP